MHISLIRTRLALVLLLLVSWGLLTIRIGAPWVGHQDANGAWISSAIRNYQRYSFVRLGGMIVLNNGLVPPDHPDSFVYYPNHPPLAVWISALPVLLVGYDETVIRFVFATCTLLGVAVLYRLTHRLLGRIQALWSVAFYIFMPMTAYFGRMPDHEAPAILLLLLFSWFIVIWLQAPTRTKWLALAILAILQSWTAWGGLIGVLTVCVASLWVGNAKQRRSIIILMLVGIAGAASVLVFYQIQWSNTFQNILGAFLWRTSSEAINDGTEIFTWTQYALRMLLRLLTLFAPTIVLIAVMGILPLLRTRARLSKVIPFALLAGGLSFALIFRNASYIHDYYLIYITPAISILAASGLYYGWHQRRAKWLRPLLVGLIITTPVVLVRYLEQLYQGSEQTTLMTISETLLQRTTADDLILSNVPTIGPAIEFYAARDITWGVTPDEAAARHDERKNVYYLRCGTGSELPLGTPVVEETEVVPLCWLTHLEN